MTTAKINFAKLTTTEQMDAAIANVAERSNLLQADIQHVAVAILCHAFRTGDYTRANTLHDALGKGVRRKGLVGWFVEGGLKVSEKDESFVGFEDGLDSLRNKAEKGDAKAKAKIVAHLDMMKGKNWWDMKPENSFMGFDFDAELERLIKRAKKAIEKDSAATAEDKSKAGYKMTVTPDHLKALMALKSNPQAMSTVQ